MQADLAQARDDVHVTAARPEREPEPDANRHVHVDWYVGAALTGRQQYDDPAGDRCSVCVGKSADPACKQPQPRPAAETVAELLTKSPNCWRIAVTPQLRLALPSSGF